MLINIVASYQQYYDIKPLSKANENLDTTTSTPKKRRLPVSTESDISPLGKRVKVLENSFSQLVNSSYFGGLLNTSSTNDSNILHSILTLKELSNNEELTDVTINAFCVSTK